MFMKFNILENIFCHLLPDPETDTEVGQTDQEHDDVADEEHVLGALQSSVDVVIISYWVVTHSLSLWNTEPNIIILEIKMKIMKKQLRTFLFL